jgi:hypothetical protein
MRKLVFCFCLAALCGFTALAQTRGQVSKDFLKGKHVIHTHPSPGAFKAKGNIPVPHGFPAGVDTSPVVDLATCRLRCRIVQPNVFARICFGCEETCRLLPTVRFAMAERACEAGSLIDEKSYITGAGVPSDHLPTGTTKTSIGCTPLNCGFSITGDFGKSAPQTVPGSGGA